MNEKYQIRKIQRSGYCRGCDKKLKKEGDWVFYTYSMRNQGTHVYFCMGCVQELSKAFEKWREVDQEIEGRFKKEDK